MSRSRNGFWMVLVTILLGLAYLLVPLVDRRSADGFDIGRVGELPVSYAGRIKPLDSVARNCLMIISGRQSFKNDGVKTDAVTWLLDLHTRPGLASSYPVFRVDHPGVRALMDIEDINAKRFSYDRLMQRGSELQMQLGQAQTTPKVDRDLMQNKVLELGNQLSLYQTLSGLFTIHIVPTGPGHQGWTPLHTTMHAGSPSGSEVARTYTALFDAYKQGDIGSFNQHAVSLDKALRVSHPEDTSKAVLEAKLNRYGLFHRTLVLYVVTGLLVLFSWLRSSEPMRQSATSLLLLVWLVHTLGIVIRVYLSGRPPVTNLYSSAIFIGWGCVLLCLILEYLFRDGIGSVSGAATGFLTLLVAQGLSGSGDSMAVLQAVLDTNFWLATHVVVITLGYASTYLAGFLGVLYILRGVFTRTLGKHEARHLAQRIYGIICFATLFSFVGTILGGIWADQSWGRFWGWDPKENGAMIIVLWNALVLHTRWGGVVKHRGLAVLAIFGSVVTSWSWFGVNMLGRGLHSYGFMDSAVSWLMLFVVSQLLIIGVGLLPEKIWRSRAARVLRLD